MFTNLLVNALEVQPQGGRILLTLEEEAGCGIIRVADDGPGIPAEVRARMFRPFYTTKEHGTGLGLSYVTNVAKAAGGSITLEDAPRGATFRLVLPLARG